MWWMSWSAAMARPEATGWLRDGVLLELYRYPPGPPVVLPRHAHEEYQLNLNLDEPGGVHYRGAYHTVPANRLAIVMPGEAHTPRDPDHRARDSTHLVLYLRPEVFGGSGNGDLPFFREPVVDDPALVDRFARLHATLVGPSPALAQDVRLLTVLTELAERYAGIGPSPPVPPAHRAVRRARDYLHDHATVNVSLAELSQAGGLSAYHLTRLFRAATGLPPHAYQVQLRIARAKRLLLAGVPVSHAGQQAGFFDLSHFTRHFRRHIGVPPGAYARSVQQERTFRTVDPLVRSPHEYA
jgi:AraC-like DNA-binding protein